MSHDHSACLQFNRKSKRRVLQHLSEDKGVEDGTVQPFESPVFGEVCGSAQCASVEATE